MREIIYFSKKAVTTGNFKDLMKAGRMDIVCHAVIMSLFISNKMRENVKLHLFFYGPPDPPRHLELIPKINEKFQLSKKDVSGLIKRMLYKYKKNKKIEVFPGCFIEKLSLEKFLSNLKNQEIYILDKNGEDIRKTEIKENSIFILGDHEGIPKKELKSINKIAKKISLGNITYFSSQSIAILNNELDRRNL
jgi:tRNA (pseudouridine54-N1)-methyltransferase